MSTDNKTLKVLKRIINIPKSLPEFIEMEYNTLIDDLNSALNSVSFSRNFQSQIFEDISIPAGETRQVYHKLRVEPKFRAILRQSGNSLITDGTFNENYVELINNGANDVILSLALFKE